jgi:hypothetical protein|tara:strand:+ start:86 stop:253 length:168 start_codon:yes stop_codon:yes gene_type:complete
MPKQGLTKENSRIVRFRLQASEIERIEAEAKARRLSVSAVIRKAIFQEYVKRVFE